MNEKRSGLSSLFLVLIVAVLGGGLWLVLEKRASAQDDGSKVSGAPVQRGPLEISVIERGNLKAADSISMKSEIEGSTTILSLIPEGTMVDEGTLVCELDATQLVTQKVTQEISVRNAEAAYVKSQQNYKIQQSQNDSDIKKAEQSLEFAQLDLKKFEEGERKAKEAQAEADIKLAEEEKTRADEKVDWSEKLNQKGFLTETELEADKLEQSRATIALEQKKRDKDLLMTYQLPRDEADLKSKFEEANRELDRVRMQADARIVDYDADMRTNEEKLGLEQEKLAKIVNQIAKAKMYAPHAGMVTYSQEDGGRYGMSQPIKEGTSVRERQEIISIPSAAGMIAQVSLHESVLKQVEIGQATTIKIDALPDREFHGKVKFVAMLPDQNSYWANPNLRLYRTEVAIDDAIGEMRPGMSCAIEVHVESIPDALFVPVQAVFRKGNDNLAFVDKAGTTEQRTVQVGRYNDRWVQVLSGVEEGETVLLAPPPGFTLQSDEKEGAPATSGAPDVAAAGNPGAAPGAPAPGAPGAADGAAKDVGGRRGDLDPAKAEEFRKRFENMSEEDKAKAREAFRNGGGSDGSRGGDRPGGGGREGGGRRRGSGPGGG